jgi:hypothetical protein
MARVKSKPIVLTDKEKQALFGAAQGVWNYIASDLLQCVAEEKGMHVNRVTIPADEVVEVVCDAGRLYEEMKRGNLLTPNLKLLLTGGYPQLVKLLLAECFTLGRYGM